jgi:hypothetical protein
MSLPREAATTPAQAFLISSFDSFGIVMRNFISNLLKKLLGRRTNGRLISLDYCILQLPLQLIINCPEAEECRPARRALPFPF